MKPQLTSKSSFTFLAPLLLLGFPTLAHAHVGMGSTAGMWHGFLHPMTGLDHVAAMLAVGLWAAQRGDRAMWLLPLAFVTVMTAGGVLGMIGIAIPFVEPAIVASLLVLGILVAAAVRMPLVASALVVGLCAFFHGHAHGSEVPAVASGVAYCVGFIVATAALHLAGIGLALAASRFGTAKLVRYAGGAIAACGLYLCICLT